MNTKVYPGMVDSHFHSQEMRKKGLTPERLLHSLVDLGMSALLDVGTQPYDFGQRAVFAARWSRIFMSEGIHPNYVKEMHKYAQEGKGDCWELLERNLRHKRVIALGEIGLDWYWEKEDKKPQIEAFRRQLELANSHSLPVIIHNREADDEVYQHIKEIHPARGGILHCFSSDYNYAKKFLDLGFYISFAGNLTYKKSTAIQEAAKKLPWEKILVETDSPYLAPMPFRGKTNHPGYLGHTIEFLAGLRGMSPVELSLMTGENFNRLFSVLEW
jgi:TatD DNase family protein